MTPRIPLTSEGILFLARKILDRSRQHQAFPDSRARCNAQGEGAAPLSSPFPAEAAATSRQRVELA